MAVLGKRLVIAVPLLMAVTCTLAVGACSYDGSGLEAPGPSADGVGDPGPNAGHAAVIRAKELEAGLVRARVVYAKTVIAVDADIDQVYESSDDDRWEEGRADGTVTMDEVVADQVFVKELRCQRLEADEVHAKEVKIGKD